MKLQRLTNLFLTFFLIAVLWPLASAFSQNVKVVNPDSSPAAVKIVSGSVITADPHVVAVPGASPSPSPAKAAWVQGAGISALPIAIWYPSPAPSPVAALPVSLASVPSHAVTNAGTFVVQATDAGANWTASNGIAGAAFTSSDQSGAVASVTSAPTSGQKLVITDIIISVDTAMRVDFNVEDSATVIESIYMAANSTVNLITRSKRKLATADKKLQVQTSVAGNIRVNAFYYSEL